MTTKVTERNGCEIRAKRYTKKEREEMYERLSYNEMLQHHRPHLCFGISFVPYGYQADVWVCQDEEKTLYHCSSECRDFAGSYKVQELVTEFEEKLWKLVEEMRKSK